MAEIIKAATRDGYGKALVELGVINDKLVVLDADLAEATKTAMFKKAYPDRFFDTGIAECNMIGVAGGLSTIGYTVFASSFAMFAAGRAFEQIRNTIGYPHLNVKIGATHAGISVGEDGASHQCCEDIALMRTIPGMVIINPADDVEARAAVFAAAEYEGPVYLRFGRLAVPRFNDPDNYKFEIGKSVQLADGKDVTIIATGLMVNEAVMARDMLEKEGISARVINAYNKAYRQTGDNRCRKRYRRYCYRRRAFRYRRTWRSGQRSCLRNYTRTGREGRRRGCFRTLRSGGRASPYLWS